MLVMPNGGLYGRYNYRLNGKHKTLALGIHPDVSLVSAKSRHQVARSRRLAFDKARVRDRERPAALNLAASRGDAAVH